MIIEKYVAPTNLDCADYGSRWKVIGQEQEDVYIQVNSDATNPVWYRLGYVLEIAFFDRIDKEELIKKLLDDFNRNK